MLNTFRSSPAFRSLAIWAGAILLVVLLVWVWVRRHQASVPNLAGATTATEGGTAYGPNGELDAYQDNTQSGPVPSSVVINANTYNNGTQGATGSSTGTRVSGNTNPPAPPIARFPHVPVRPAHGPAPIKPVVGHPAPRPINNYVTVVPWHPGSTPWNSTLWGIANHYHTSVSHLLSLPGNARYRSNPNLLHVGDRVQVG